MKSNKKEDENPNRNFHCELIFMQGKLPLGLKIKKTTAITKDESFEIYQEDVMISKVQTFYNFEVDKAKFVLEFLE